MEVAVKISTKVAVKSNVIQCGDEAQIESSKELLINLRAMVNKPQFSDVVFLCNDENRVHGSRMLLSGMSDVLKSLLMNGMVESSLAEVSLPEISSLVLLAVFEFLYTGTLVNHSPQTWTIACEVIIASRFFLLPNLEKITRTLMHDQIEDARDDLQKVALLLTEAVRFKDLCEQPDDYLGDLVFILSPNLAGCAFLECLSEDAFHYLLENSKNNSEDDDELSFEEYVRVKQVIRWTIHHSGRNEFLEFVDSMFPPRNEALYLYRDSFSCSSDKVETPDADAACLLKWNSLLQDGEKQLRQAVYRLMSNIDCRRIHPILVAKVLEPMKIISAEQIMSALRFHALRRTMILNRLECYPECYWSHGESYRVCEEGYGIEKIGKKTGVAVPTLPMSRLFGVYQWRFVLVKPSTSFLELGFVQSGVQDEEGAKLSDDCSARVLRFAKAVKEEKLSVTWKDGGGQWKTLEPRSEPPAVFTYNASEHTCSLSLNDKDYGVIWKNLPRATYYPAVCLGNSSDGQVRIELVSGFDFLYI